MIRTAIISTVISASIALTAGIANGQGCLLGVGYNGASCSSSLPGANGRTATNNNGGSTTTTGGTIAKGGTINPGGGTSKATGVADLVLASNGAFYGTAYAYNGSHFELYTTDGGVLKTFANSCKDATPSGGVAGVVCSFGQWDRSGRQIYSGWTYIYANGVVYLRWMYQARSNFQYVDGDTGWVMLRPR